MTDKSVSLVTKMLDFLYTGDYSETVDERPDNDLLKMPALLILAL